MLRRNFYILVSLGRIILRYVYILLYLTQFIRSMNNNYIFLNVRNIYYTSYKYYSLKYILLLHSIIYTCMYIIMYVHMCMDVCLRRCIVQPDIRGLCPKIRFLPLFRLSDAFCSVYHALYYLGLFQSLKSPFQDNQRKYFMFSCENLVYSD